MRRDEKMVSALLDCGADPNAPLRTWTPTRRSSHDFHFEPALVGATPFWLAARFTEPGVMRLLVKHGADPLFVHHSDEVLDRRVQAQDRSDDGSDGGDGNGRSATAWVQPARSAREALTLEAVKTGGGPGRRCQCRRHRRPHGAGCREGAEVRQRGRSFWSKRGVNKRTDGTTKSPRAASQPDRPRKTMVYPTAGQRPTPQVTSQTEGLLRRDSEDSVSVLPSDLAEYLR